MFSRIRAMSAALLLAALVVFCAGQAALAQDNAWRVSKVSGDVSVTTSGGQQGGLANGATVKPGDNIRTGQNGRVLLTRGQETILISPNSAIGIPMQKSEGMSTTIVQQAGSILLEVEKRNVKHFAVETPYLAAVVKGTQFRVTVDAAGSRVDVLKGQVEVADFKSGQYALVKPDQAAKVSIQGQTGLSLSGSGALSPVQQGTPRRIVNPIAAADIKPGSEPVRVASAGEGRAAASWSGTSTKDSSASGWSSPFSFGRSSGSRTRNEDMAIAAGVACAVGFLVAAGVGFQRRRKSRKLAQG
jgi:hypothetical protein